MKKSIAVMNVPMRRAVRARHGGRASAREAGEAGVAWLRADPVEPMTVSLVVMTPFSSLP
jgi:hypothetical protein